jgi:hypothetical protein
VAEVQVEVPVLALASAPAQDLAVDMEAAPQVQKISYKHLRQGESKPYSSTLTVSANTQNT